MGKNISVNKILDVIYTGLFKIFFSFYSSGSRGVRSGGAGGGEGVSPPP